MNARQAVSLAVEKGMKCGSVGAIMDELDKVLNYPEIGGDRGEKATTPRVSPISWENNRLQGITFEMMGRWSKAYPAVTLSKELYAMEQWLIANPAKMKKNLYRFITNWMARKQEGGR